VAYEDIDNLFRLLFGIFTILLVLVIRCSRLCWMTSCALLRGN